MKKIPSLFKRNYNGDRLVYDETVPGSEWVAQGEGIATIKYDGTACLIRNGKLYKRYDRRPTRKAKKHHQDGKPWKVGEFKAMPPSWEPCEPEPNAYTGHWPGWVPVGDGPEDKWHREGFENYLPGALVNGTYELVGPKVQGNPHNLTEHQLWCHGGHPVEAPRDFDGLRKWFIGKPYEGIVWHRPDGRMVKIKRRDFGLPWPIKEEPSNEHAQTE